MTYHVRSWLAIATGAGLLAASSYAVIISSHQDLPHAILTAAMAIGILAGAMAISAAWRQQRRSLALWLVLAMVAAEAFGVMMTADRIVAEREASQASVRKAQAARAYAETELDKANSALAKANAAAVTEAAKMGCKVNCRQLLEGQVTLAKAGVDRAVDLLRANPHVTASGSPLADRLGWQPWVIDLLIAGLLSIGANGLAAALVAFGCHARPPVAQPQAVHQALTFERPLTDQEIEDLRKVLRSHGTLSNRALARVMGVTDGEASKRVSKAIAAGVVARRKTGKEVAIGLLH